MYENEALSEDVMHPTVGIAASPTIAGWIYSACSYVIQTHKRREQVEEKIKINNKVKTKVKYGKGTDFCLRTGPDAIYTTKFRVPRGTYLPHFISNPDYDQILAIAKGEWKE